MSEGLGGSNWFHMSEANTPITYKAAEYFNTSNARMQEGGLTVDNFVAVTQDNISALLRAMADLELQVQQLKGQ